MNCDRCFCLDLPFEKGFKKIKIPERDLSKSFSGADYIISPALKKRASPPRLLIELFHLLICYRAIMICQKFFSCYDFSDE